MENNIKTKRTANFAHSEECLLVKLAKKYKEILENKKSDVNVTRKKNECWLNIESEFNSQSGIIFRGAIVLRKKYENIKKRTKKMIADEKCYRKATGGGPHKEFSVDSVESDIIELLGEKRVEGLQATFGGDKNADNMEFYVEHETNKSETVVINAENETVISENGDDISCVLNETLIKPVNNWTKYTPEMLKLPPSKPLNTGKENNEKSRKKPENPVVTKVLQWASVKADMEAHKKIHSEEEHKLKMKLMQEKHDVEVALLKEEAEVKMSALKEENKIKIEILRMQKIALCKSLNSAAT